MEKRKLLALIGSFCLILALAAAIPFTAEGGTPTPASTSIIIRVALSEAPTSITFLKTQECAKNTEARSGGRLRFELYPLNQLVGQKLAFDTVKSGAIEMIAMSMALFEGIVPLEGGFRLPFLYESRDHGYAAWQAGQKDLMQEALDKHKHKILAFSCPTSRGSAIFTTFPVRIPGDLKGHKIRVTGGQGPVIAAAGGAPVTMPAAEYYMALERKTIDGVITGIEMGIGRSLYEVVRYACLVELDQGFTFFSMNMDFFNKLPRDLQTILMEEFGEKYWQAETKALPEAYAAAMKKYKDAGVVFYEPTPTERTLWRELTTEKVREWTAKVGEPGKKWLEISDKTRPK